LSDFLFCFVLDFFYIGGWEVIGLKLAKQALYFLSHSPAYFALITFEIGSSVFAQTGLEL
jgi:hypothetical protein